MKRKRQSLTLTRTTPVIRAALAATQQATEKRAATRQICLRKRLNSCRGSAARCAMVPAVFLERNTKRQAQILKRQNSRQQERNWLTQARYLIMRRRAQLAI